MTRRLPVLRRLVLLAAGVLALTVLAGCLVPRPPGAAPLRYRDAVFADVDVSRDVQYGTAPNSSGAPVALRLDVYNPRGDTRTRRPALVFAHGGGFSGGDKASGVSPDLAGVFARRGYLTVSINYRLTTARCGGSSLPPECTTAALDAQHDAQAAVRWLRANAAFLEVDPTRIGIGGESAGGITAALVGLHSEDPGSSGNPGFSSSVGGFASISGGLPGGVFAGAGDAPGVLFSNRTDPVVPAQWTAETAQKLLEAGVPAFPQFAPGSGHVPYGSFRDRIIEQSSYFFYTFLDVAHAQGQPAAAARAADRQAARARARYRGFAPRVGTLKRGYRQYVR